MCATVYETVALRSTCRANISAEQVFFQDYNILPLSGVRAESLRAGSENIPIFVTFWPTLYVKDDQEKIQVVTSLMTLKVHHV